MCERYNEVQGRPVGFDKRSGRVANVFYANALIQKVALMETCKVDCGLFFAKNRAHALLSVLSKEKSKKLLIKNLTASQKIFAPGIAQRRGFWHNRGLRWIYQHVLQATD